MAVGHTSGDILWPCASGTARRGHQCRLVTGSRHKIVQRGRMGLCPCAMIRCFGSSVSVASSICPASVCAQGVCKLPSAQSHTVFTPKCIVCAWCGPLSALLMRTANRRPGRYKRKGLLSIGPSAPPMLAARCCCATAVLGGMWIRNFDGLGGT